MKVPLTILFASLLLFGGSRFAAAAGAGPPGTLDRTFQPAFGSPSPAIRRLALAPDGAIYVSGANLSSPSGKNDTVLRLQPDGRLDASFTPRSLENVSAISAMAVDHQGRLLLAIFESRVINGSTYVVHSVCRLLPNGDVDTAFKRPYPAAGGHVTEIALDEAGRIYLSGSFTLPSGRSTVARLLDDGSPDPLFLPRGTPSLSAGERYQFAAAGDGHMYLFARSIWRYAPDGTATSLLNDQGYRRGFVDPKGRFVAASPTTVRRHLQNGGYDSSFVAHVSASDIVAVIPGPNETTLVVSQRGIVRLLGSGIVDAGYHPPVFGEYSITTGVADPLGRACVGGSFTQVTAEPYPGLVRLHSGFVSVVAIDPIMPVEEADGTQRITIRRHGDVNEPLNLKLTATPGTAIGTIDFVPGSYEIAFAAGVAEATADIAIRDDDVVEPDETYTVVLSSASTGVLGARSRAGAAILRQSAGRLSLPPEVIKVTETGEILRLPVTRTGGTEGAITVTARTNPVNAVPGRDFVPLNATYTMSSGQSLLEIPLQLLETDLREGSRRLTLRVDSSTQEVPSTGATIEINDAGDRATVADYAGSYRGFVQYHGQPALLTIGFGRGSSVVTGTLRAGDQTFSVRGQVQSNGVVSFTLPPRGDSPGQHFTFHLQGTRANPSIGGSADATVTSELVVLHAIRRAAEVPAGLTGAYTFLIPPLEGVQGLGWASVRLRQSGIVNVSGRLADGPPFSAAGWLSPEGKVALASPLPAGAGTLSLELAFTAGPIAKVSGTVSWFERDGTAVQQKVTVSGAQFSPRILAEWASGQSIAMQFPSANEAAPGGAPVTLVPTHHSTAGLHFAAGPKLQMVFAPAGYFFGHRVLDDRIVKFNGVWLVEENRGRGALRGWFPPELEFSRN